MPHAKKSDAAKKNVVRYAVVGLGYIAQAAILPAFKHAKRNSQLAAVVSGDPVKLKRFGKGKVAAYSYDDYERCLLSGDVDAVVIALPNSMHQEFAVRAAKAGVHVLCEKPMAVTENECNAIGAACEQNGVRLMIAYRLHFEKGTLEAIRIANSGKLGEIKCFQSSFTMQVRDQDNIRLKADLGGGPLYDIGVYCINAARGIFREEPIEVMAMSTAGRDDRFDEVDECTSAMLRYPSGRVASFTCSFGASDVSEYRVIGTKGSLRMNPAYEYAEGLAMQVTVGARTTSKRFPRTDQFAAELLYFSECVLNHREPEPSGAEGLLDVRIIEALLRSADEGAAVMLEPLKTDRSPKPRQAISRPPVRKPQLVHASSPSGK